MEQKTSVKPEQSQAQESPLVIRRPGAALPLGILLVCLLRLDAEARQPVASLLARCFWREDRGQTIRASTRPHCHPVAPHLARSRLPRRSRQRLLVRRDRNRRARYGRAEAYLSTGSHDFSHPALQLVTAKITIGDDAFVARALSSCPAWRSARAASSALVSVVTKDVPPDVFAAGNPCRVLRRAHEFSRPELRGSSFLGDHSAFPRLATLVNSSLRAVARHGYPTLRRSPTNRFARRNRTSLVPGDSPTATSSFGMKSRPC